MRIGQSYPVLLQAESNTFHVADAVVIEVDGDEVTIEVPGTILRMTVATSLAEPKQEGPDRLVTHDSDTGAGDLEFDDSPEARARELDLTDGAQSRGTQGGRTIHERTLDSSVLD